MTGHPIMGVSDHGFVAQLPRGPHRSRYYLQCALSDRPADRPDTRLRDDTIPNAVVHEKEFVPLRSVVQAPMQYRNLFLAGDAAHLVPPTGAKGRSLALYDVDVLARALVDAVLNHDTTALTSYSDTVLPHVCRYQEFSAWMTDTLHAAGDPTRHGTIRQMSAHARLDELFSSAIAGRLHSECQQGMV